VEELGQPTCKRPLLGFLSSGLRLLWIRENFWNKGKKESVAELDEVQLLLEKR
jgi:hypothetical protein